jgi:uncharacterized protein
MSDLTLEKYIESYIQAQPVPEVLFTWHGGEPLLRDISFYRKALAFQKKYGRGRKIDNSLQTNGILLNDEWCRFFKDNNFLIGISIDGPEHCHDYYRKNKGGKGTFKQVMRGIELLQKHQVEFNTLSVIHNYNIDFPLEIYHFFKEIGSQYMQFTPIVEQLSTNSEDGLILLPPEGNTDAQIAPWNVDPIKFGEFYIQIFDEWVKKDGRYFVQLLMLHWPIWLESNPAPVFLVKLVVMQWSWNLTVTFIHAIILCFLNTNWEILKHIRWLKWHFQKNSFNLDKTSAICSHRNVKNVNI